jgi:hypothetical protein
VSIQTISSELKTLRARLDAQRTNTHSWPSKEEELAADLDRYDRRLLKAASMLGVEAPPARRHDGFLLAEEERRLLEQRLAVAGVDVRSSAAADEAAQA